MGLRNANGITVETVEKNGGWAFVCYGNDGPGLTPGAFDQTKHEAADRALLGQFRPEVIAVYSGQTQRIIGTPTRMIRISSGSPMRQ